MFRPEFVFITFIQISTQIQIGESISKPNNTHVTNSNYLLSMFIFNYDKESDDEQFHLFKWLGKTTSTTTSTTSTTTSPTTTTSTTTAVTTTIPTTTELSTTEPTTTELTTTELSTTELSTTELSTTELSTTELSTTELTTTEEIIPPTTIISGERVMQGEYPFMAIIGWSPRGDTSSYSLGCSGTLIRPDYVLTVGHCFSSNHYDIYVDLGDIDIYSKTATRIKARRFIAHPEHKLTSKYNDIGLVQLERAVNLTAYISPACVQQKNRVVFEDEIVFAAGWGAVKYNESPLLKSNYALYPKSRCVGRQRPQEIVDKIGCAGIPGGRRDICQNGYDGGPIFITDYESECKFWIIGVISMGPMQCGGRHDADSYTNLSPYLDWIANVTSLPINNTKKDHDLL